MQINNFFQTKIFLRKIKFGVCLLSFLFCTIKSQAVNARIDDMRFGVSADVLLTKNIGVFYEYDFVPFVGVRVGLEHGNDFFMIVPKGIELSSFGKTIKDKWINKIEKYNIANVEPKNLSDAQKQEFQKDMQSEWGYYEVSFISIPLSARLYPFAGDLCVHFGLRLDILLSASGVCVNNANQENVDSLKAPFEKPEDDLFKAKEKVSAVKKEIKKDEKKFDGTNLLNSTRLSFISGFDYTFFFGLIIGGQFRGGITSFVNYDSKESEPFLDKNLQISIGLDIAKIINLC